jgi:hypothetical protein
MGKNEEIFFNTFNKTYRYWTVRMFCILWEASGGFLV